MRVILLQDMPNLGRAGDIKTVSDGYARNYLIPRGWVKPATAREMKQLEQYKHSASRRVTREMTDARAMAERLSGMTLMFKAKAGEGTRLYGSITSSDIAERLSQELGRDFDRRKIQLDTPLRQLGTHQVPIRLQADIVPELTVVIEREESSEL